MILGARMRPDHKAKVQERVEGRRRPVAVFEARIDATRFRLNFAPLNDAAAAESSGVHAA